MKTLQLYTFQIHPISKDFQFDLWGGSHNQLEWLISKKVDILRDAFLSESFRMIHPRKQALPLIERVIHDEDEYTIMRIGVRREIEMTDRNLKNQRVEHFPNIYVIIDWQYQSLAIERDSAVFQESESVANIFKANFNRAVKRYNLEVHIKPQFRIREFWNEIHEHSGKIVSLKFDLVAPNMPRISTTIPDDLKLLQKETGAKEATVELKGSSGSPLLIEEENADIRGLAEYAGKGGGSISYRVKGVTRIQTTGKSIKETKIEEMEIQGDPDSVVRLVRETINSDE